jgi:hypothetical protein
MFSIVIRKQIGRNVIFAIVLVALGISWLSYLGPDHSACSSILVTVADQSACRGDAIRWYLAWGLILVGVTFGILAVVGYIKKDEVHNGVQYCPNCGAPAQIIANNCSNCGASLKAMKQS